MRSMFIHMRRRWYIYLVIGLIWILAIVRVLVDPTPRVPLLFNTSSSLPYLVAVVEYGPVRPVRGAYVIYAFAGPAVRMFPGSRNQPFFKQVRGLPGDHVTVRARHVYINGVDVGVAKQILLRKIPLVPISDMVIPPGYYYLAGTGSESFDSRYALSGLVRKEHMLANVRPLF